MADGQFSAVIGAIRRVGGGTDRQLLEQFAEARDEAAFTALVRRHSSLVLGVCRRVLRHEQDAEDAFQATFLVLARKARTVRWHESVANWLHGVAYRLALKVRSANARRQAHARETAMAASQDAPASAAWQELRSVLDEELARLPEKFRAPLVLCYLQGKTRDEAAQRLGWTLPTVKGRLERGRELLRARLTRRGLTLSAALFGVALAESSAAAAAPALVSSTVSAAVHFAAGQAVGGGVSVQALTLTQGVLRAMLLTKLKLTAAVLLTVSVLGLGTGALTRHVLATGPQEQDNQAVAPSSGRSGDAAGLVPLSAEEFYEIVRADERDGRRGDTKKPEKEVRGRLKAIDLDKGTLTVFPTRDGNRDDETFSLSAKDVQVKSDQGNALKLADLKSGMTVVLRLSPTDDVVSIQTLPAGGRGREEPGARRGDAQAEGARERGGRGVAGVLKAVDADKKTVTLTTGREGAAKESTFDVPDDVRLAVPGTRQPKLTDLKAGMQVLVVPSADGKSAVAIAAQPAREREAQPDLIGLLKSVDLNKKTLTVAVGRGQDDEKTFSLPEGIKVMGLGREAGTIADLKPGMRVALRLTENKKEIAAIYATNGDRPGDRNSIQGVLKSVEGGKITVTQRGGRDAKDKDETFTLSDEVRVTTNLRETRKIEDLKAGMRVMLVLSRDRTSVVGVLIIMPEGGRRAPEEGARPRREP